MPNERLSAALLGLFVLSFAAVSSLAAVPAAYAGTTITIDDLASCSSIGASWDSFLMDCTLAGSYTVDSGDTLVATSDTLIVTSTGSLVVDSGGVLDVQNSGFESGGITVFGSLTNYGTISITSSGEANSGLGNEPSAGIITNYGTIDIQNSGSGSQGFFNGSYVYNYGTINVENSGGTGIYNSIPLVFPVRFYNYGKIDIENSGGIGVDNSNGGTFVNECSGTIIGSILGGYTQATGCQRSVPEFPLQAAGLGPLLLIALLLPALLIMARKFRKPLLYP